MHRRINLADCALNLGMTGMTDQDDCPAQRGIAAALAVHFGDQRARGVNHRQGAGRCIRFHRARHPMRAENCQRAGRNLIQFINKNRAHTAQTIHHMFIVNNLMPDINRRTIAFERAFNNFYCSDNARAKSAWLRKDNFQSYAPFVCRLRPLGLFHFGRLSSLFILNAMP